MSKGKTNDGVGLRGEEAIASNAKATAHAQGEIDKARQERSRIDADRSLTETEKQRRLDEIDERITNWSEKLPRVM